MALGEDFHTGGAVLGDEGPAVATLNGYHGVAPEDVVHEALAQGSGRMQRRP